MSRRPSEIDIRKGIHIKLLPQTHAEFRVLCFRKGLSMQEVLEELSALCIQENPKMIKILDNLAERKREKTPVKLTTTDAESLFNEIERESPFND